MTAPKHRKRRKSPIFTKCEDLMEILWNDGYRKQIPRKKLYDYVLECCGGFRTTIADYLGKRATYYKRRGMEGVLKCAAKPGYLEKFGFIQYDPRRVFLVTLLHSEVERNYHSQQTNMVSFSLSNSTDEHDLVVAPMGAIERGRRERDRQSEREIRETESIPLTSQELAVLKAAKEGNTA